MRKMDRKQGIRNKCVNKQSNGEMGRMIDTVIRKVGVK